MATVTRTAAPTIAPATPAEKPKVGLFAGKSAKAVAFNVPVLERMAQLAEVQKQGPDAQIRAIFARRQLEAQQQADRERRAAEEAAARLNPATGREYNWVGIDNSFSHTMR